MTTATARAAHREAALSVTTDRAPRPAHRTRKPAPRPSALDRAMAARHMPALHPHGYYVIESLSRPGLDHLIDLNERGFVCSCEAADHGNPDCWHIAALVYCLEHRIMGVYTLCANCRSARVAKVGAWCVGCAAMAALVAAQERAHTACHACGQVLKVGEPCPDCVASVADPVHARQRAITAARPANVVPFARSGVSTNGASPAYLASLERDAARARALSESRAVARAAAPRAADPLAALFG